MEGVTSKSALGRETGKQRRILLANPRGFCAGVERAIDTVERALKDHGAPIYVRRAIVHNQEVVERLEKQGAIFVQQLDEIPRGSIAILSAHGSARQVLQEARARDLRTVDSICPLVAKIHSQVEGWYRAGRHVLLIGHQGHPEIVGTLGQLPSGSISVVSSAQDIAALDLPSNTAIAYVIQTTFAVRDADSLIDEINRRFSDVAAPRASSICYATANRQESAEAIAQKADLFLVVGDERSSNARRLAEVVRIAGCKNAALVRDERDLPWSLIEVAETIGLTAGASSPESAVERVCRSLEAHGFAKEEISGKVERVTFRPVSLEPLAQREREGSIEDRLVSLRKDIDKVLEIAIGRRSGHDKRLADAIRYAVVGSGKRFRASLVMAVSELVGGDYSQAIRVGAAIECIHAQSLVHDDLPCMDNDDLRRGKPTLHRKFDEATAVLAGDALMALGFELLADQATNPDADVRARLVLSLSKAIGQDGLAGGQMMDLYPPAQPTEQFVFACESRKTASLIRFAVEAGAMLGRCTPDEMDRLLLFAENLGLVFQIRDDLLDNIGDVELVGKAVNKDADSGRASATVLMGVGGATEEARKRENACYEALDGFGEQAIPLMDIARFAANRMH
ncbi:MAG TPA: 4-hydroxy-3-methylbut-2-enyl diphosphate reductase [Erythrobacter sp.]|nr:4-hydroxy-3-methylbut-2-enyl diphosphate reductase [Erythrobacter sp.]